MTVRIKPEKTSQGVRAALEAMMAQNSRKQVFHALGNADTGELAAAPEADIICIQGEAWRGLCGIWRRYWNTVPGYAEKVCADLLDCIGGNRK